MQGVITRPNQIMGLTPTEEQWFAIDLASQGLPFALNALAGTGKSSTLKMSASVFPGELVLLVFNRPMAIEARESFKGLSNIKVYTSHAYARQYVRVSQERLNLRLHGKFVAQRYGLGRYVLGKNAQLNPAAVGNCVLMTVSRFCNSAASEITYRHVPSFETLFGKKPADLDFDEMAIAELQGIVVSAARKLWSDQIDPTKSNIPIKHDTYLKQWLLTNPQINASVMMDESQDTNDALLNVVMQQNNPPFWVGDKYQQIYDWRGAVNAMEKIQCDNTGFLTQSFRFGEKVAFQANRILRYLGSDKDIIGSGGQPKTGTVAYLARTNAECLRVMMECIENNRTDVALVGGDKYIPEIKVLGDIANGMKGYGSYALFQNWSDVKEFAQSGEGGDVSVLVKMIDEYGADKLTDVLEKQSKIKSKYIISTCHKSKGLEYDYVKLADDWKTDEDGNPMPLSEAEARLFYVALTRARCDVNTELVQPWIDITEKLNNNGVTAKEVDRAMKSS